MPDIPDWFIPILIFLARICDVSIGTFRMLMVISGKRLASAALGFVEVLIWVLAVGGAVKHLDNPVAILAFAGGYASGTLIGMTVENKLAFGYRLVRAINPVSSTPLTANLREKGYAATRIDGTGRDGPVEVVFIAIRRRHVPELMEAIAQTAPDAFITIERAERVTGHVPIVGSRAERSPWGRFGQLRK